MALTLNSDGDLLASGGGDNKILIWSVFTDEIIESFDEHSDSISVGGLAFSPDSQLLASASYDGTVRIWDLISAKAPMVLKGHTNRVEAIAFSPNGEILGTGSSDLSIRLWSCKTGQTTNVLSGHENAVLSLLFTEDGKELVSTSIDRTLRIWDIDSGVNLRVLQGHTSSVTDVAYDNGIIYSSGNNGKIFRWDERKTRSMRIFDIDNEALSVAITPDGSRLAIGYSSGNLAMYSLPEVKFIWKLERAHSNYINRIAFSPDNMLLASGSYDNSVILWRAKDGTKIETLKGHQDAIYSLSFSKNGEMLASAGFDGPDWPI